MASCTTTSYVQSDDGQNELLYNPYGNEVLYSSNWGWYYYDNLHRRFLFDEYISRHQTNLTVGWYNKKHRDYNQYNNQHKQNYSDKANGNKDYIRGSVSNFTKSNSSNTYQQGYKSNQGNIVKRSYSNVVKQNTSNSPTRIMRTNSSVRRNVQTSSPIVRNTPQGRSGMKRSKTIMVKTKK